MSKLFTLGHIVCACCNAHSSILFQSSLLSATARSPRVLSREQIASIVAPVLRNPTCSRCGIVSWPSAKLLWHSPLSPLLCRACMLKEGMAFTRSSGTDLELVKIVLNVRTLEKMNRIKMPDRPVSSGVSMPEDADVF